MNLSFTTNFKNGRPTHFEAAIWFGIRRSSDWVGNRICLQPDYFEYNAERKRRLGVGFSMPLDGSNISPKFHTIRADTSNRFEAGKLIHPTIYPRSTRMFQFAPTLVCPAVLPIKITWCGGEIRTDVDGVEVNPELVARNDGLTFDRFCEWFSTDFEGKIIFFPSLKLKNKIDEYSR